jgi:hypothetical protein
VNQYQTLRVVRGLTGRTSPTKMRVPKWVKMRITHYEQCFRCLSNSGRWDSGRDQTTVFRLTPGLLGSRPIFHVAGRSLLRSSGRAYRRADCPWRAWNGPPCILHLPFVIAGDWHCFPFRVFAPQPLARCISKSMGLILRFGPHPPTTLPTMDCPPSWTWT